MSEINMKVQICKIIPGENHTIISVAKNIYKKGEGNEAWTKKGSVFLNCLCRFQPRIKVGDSAIMLAHYESKCEGKPQIVIDNIGVIEKGENDGKIN